MISLENEVLRCTLSAEAGGSVLGLWLGDEPVFSPLALVSPHDAQPPTSLPRAGSYPLVPYSNRIGNASLRWQGETYALQPNFAPEPHAIHGVGWQRPWELVRHETQRATLRYLHTPDGHWPFAFEATQTIALEGNTLRMQMAVKNLGQLVAPVGLGWHPYFVKRDLTHISFNARGRWEMGPDQLPTQLASSEGLDADCTHLRVDHCFDGWSGSVQLRDEVMHCEVDSSLRHLVVYTRPEIGAIAIEPASHVNDAFNRFATVGGADALGVRTLQQDEIFDAWMSVKVSLAAA